MHWFPLPYPYPHHGLIDSPIPIFQSLPSIRYSMCQKTFPHQPIDLTRRMPPSLACYVTTPDPAQPLISNYILGLHARCPLLLAHSQGSQTAGRAIVPEFRPNLASECSQSRRGFSHHEEEIGICRRSQMCQFFVICTHEELSTKRGRNRCGHRYGTGI